MTKDCRQQEEEDRCGSCFRERLDVVDVVLGVIERFRLRTVVVIGS